MKNKIFESVRSGFKSKFFWVVFTLLFLSLVLILPYDEYESCGEITSLGICSHLIEKINLFSYFFGDLPKVVGSPDSQQVLQIFLWSFFISIVMSFLALISNSVRWGMREYFAEKKNSERDRLDREE